MFTLTNTCLHLQPQYGSLNKIQKKVEKVQDSNYLIIKAVKNYFF